MTDLIQRGSAIFSACGTYRWRLDRILGGAGIVYAYFGVNGSTATGEYNDHTVVKWNGFTLRNGGGRYIVGNLFGRTATDVSELCMVADPVGSLNDAYLAEIIAEADVLVPCWGSRLKLPSRLRPRIDVVKSLIFSAGKPVKIFGLTDSGDPLHPLTLAYSTPLIDWTHP
ncbi:DUF1643 domain-containing protein [Pararhizobium sp. LjRoot235]|uniref:DUF1643 domain-containing protein n=1 Tax=Pararhizobium sp. LjRoot235 TaxID=3342291 RepID=UPI003ECFFA06